MSCLKTSISMENVIVVGNRLRNFESNYPTKLHREFWPTGCKKKELTWIITNHIINKIDQIVKKNLKIDAS